jgi:Erythromycin biosynthesis protein CIII-like, C-terminal domain
MRWSPGGSCSSCGTAAPRSPTPRTAGTARARATWSAAEIERFGTHALAVDWVLTGAAVAGEAAGVPTAVLLHGNNLLPEPGKPAPGFGLRPLGHALEQLERPARLLCLYPEAFDLPADRHPAHLRYVGPVLEPPAWAEPWNPPWPPDDQRPLVVVSMSTTYMRQERVLGRCVEAVAALPVRALVTVGPTLDPAALQGPGNVVVVASAPHDQVFPHAGAVITHAGMGTVMRALAHGLPLVCIPQGRDQHDVAARVRWHGAGLRLGTGASAAKVRAALGRVLDEPSFREAAGRLQRAIQADLAADRGVAELETLASAGNAAVPYRGSVASPRTSWPGRGSAGMVPRRPAW